MGLTEKLSLIQQKMKAPKNLYNKFGNYPYRNAEGILEAFKPFESDYKVALTVTDDMAVIGDRVYVKATAKLMDCESQVAISTTAFAREAREKKGMDDAQITGSASSYARKYALNGLFLLDDNKDVDSEEGNGKAKPNSRENGSSSRDIPAGKQGEPEANNRIELLRNQLTEECKRTGRGKLFLKNEYGIDDPLQLSEDQLSDAVGKLRTIPNKRASR